MCSIRFVYLVLIKACINEIDSKVSKCSFQVVYLSVEFALRLCTYRSVAFALFPSNRYISAQMTFCPNDLMTKRLFDERTHQKIRIYAPVAVE